MPNISYLPALYDGFAQSRPGFFVFCFFKARPKIEKHVKDLYDAKCIMRVKVHVNAFVCSFIL